MADVIVLHAPADAAAAGEIAAALGPYRVLTVPVTSGAPAFSLGNSMIQIAVWSHAACSPRVAPAWPALVRRNQECIVVTRDDTPLLPCLGAAPRTISLSDIAAEPARMGNFIGRPSHAPTETPSVPTYGRGALRTGVGIGLAVAAGGAVGTGVFAAPYFSPVAPDVSTATAAPAALQVSFIDAGMIEPASAGPRFARLMDIAAPALAAETDASLFDDDMFGAKPLTAASVVDGLSGLTKLDEGGFTDVSLLSQDTDHGGFVELTPLVERIVITADELVVVAPTGNGGPQVSR
jgi:hypothetical protein